MTSEISDELPDAVHSQVSALSERGNIMLESGDAKAAIGLWMQALQLLPQPTQRWEAAMWLHASIADAYRSMGDLENAVYHLRISYESDGGASNPFVLISLGATLYDLGKIDDSVDPLLRAYMLEGTEIFAEFGGPYLNVLKDRNLIK